VRATTRADARTARTRFGLIGEYVSGEGSSFARRITRSSSVSVIAAPARAGNRQFGRLGALRAHTKAPYKPDLLRRTLRARNQRSRAGPKRKPRPPVGSGVGL
jgi:hypothetical protein